MDHCRVDQETTAHLDRQAVLESQPHMVKCLECNETKPANEMYLIGQWNDEEGLCGDCSQIIILSAKFIIGLPVSSEVYKYRKEKY